TKRPASSGRFSLEERFIERRSRRPRDRASAAGATPKGRAKEVMDRQSDRLPRQTRCEGMRIKREIQMGASGGGQSIKAGRIAARTGRTQTRNRHDSPKPKTLLTRGGRPHKFPPAANRTNSETSSNGRGVSPATFYRYIPVARAQPSMRDNRGHIVRFPE